MGDIWQDAPFGGGVVIDKNRREYLWKETRNSNIIHVKDRDGEDLYFGKVRSCIVVVGINPKTDLPERYKVRKIDCTDVANVIEYFKVVDLRYAEVDEQEDEGFVFWRGYTDPFYERCTQDEAMQYERDAKVVRMYCK